MGYRGWKLSDESRNDLLTIIPPCNPDVIAHHITLDLSVSEMPPEMNFVIIGVLSEPGLQTLVCQAICPETGSCTMQRPKSGVYHITWSIDREAGVRPVHSNAMIERFMLDNTFSAFSGGLARNVEYCRAHLPVEVSPFIITD